MICVTIGVNKSAYYINKNHIQSITLNKITGWTTICLTGSCWERHIEVHESIEELLTILKKDALCTV